jgi:hypothetical protein
MPLAERKGTDAHKGLPSQDLRFEVINEGSVGGVDLEKSNLTTFRRRYDMSWELK